MHESERWTGFRRRSCLNKKLKAKRRSPLDLSRKPEGWVEAKLGTGLCDRHRPILLGDIVDARSAARHGKQCGLCRGIDMDWRFANGVGMPGAWAIEEAVTQHDRFQS